MMWGKDTFRGAMEPVRRNKVPWYHTADWTTRMGDPAPRQIKKTVPWKQTRSGQPLRSKCRVQLKFDGTRWRAGGEVKGKQANGVDSQYSSTLPRNMVYPALLPTIKTNDKLPSSMVSRELSSKIRQFQHHCFHITLNLLLTQWVQLFPVLWYICQLQLGWHPVAGVQYTCTYK